MRGFQSLRGRLTAVAFVIGLLAVAVITVAFNLVLSVSLNHDASKGLQTQAAAAGTVVAVKGGRVVVRDPPGDAGFDRVVWVYEGRRTVERAIGTPPVQRAADALAGSAHVFRELTDGTVRFYAAPVRARGRQVGTVVVAQPLAAYNRTRDLALAGSLAVAAGLLAAMFVLTSVVIRRALDPVQAMTHSAADWSEHGVEQRFGETRRPAELAELAHTFDALLDRVAGSLRHERRLSAELSHELRTPLARVVAQVELLERRERPPQERRAAYASIARSAEDMSGILETLLAAARADAGVDQGRCGVGAALAGIGRTWTPVFAERGLHLALAPVDPSLTAGVEENVLGRVVAPLLDNASRYARSRVVVVAIATDGRVAISVGDDGPGVSPEAREAVFEPGTSIGDGNGHAATGLGLALARRLARAAGGDVGLVRTPAGRLATFTVELPC